MITAKIGTPRMNAAKFRCSWATAQTARREASRGSPMKPRMSQRIQFSLAYLLVAVIVLSFLQSWLLAPRTIEIPMSKFFELLKADEVEKVAVTEREIRGIAKPGALPSPPSAPGDRLRKLLGSEEETRVFVTTRIPLVDDQQLINELRAHNVEFAGR